MVSIKHVNVERSDEGSWNTYQATPRGKRAIRCSKQSHRIEERWMFFTLPNLITYVVDTEVLHNHIMKWSLLNRTSSFINNWNLYLNISVKHLAALDIITKKIGYHGIKKPSFVLNLYITNTYVLKASLDHMRRGRDKEWSEVPCVLVLSNRSTRGYAQSWPTS